MRDRQHVDSARLGGDGSGLLRAACGHHQIHVGGKRPLRRVFCLRPRRHEVAVRRLSARPVPTRPNHARRSTLAGPSLFLAAV